MSVYICVKFPTLSCLNHTKCNSHIGCLGDVRHELDVLGLEPHVKEFVVVAGEDIGCGRLPREAVAGRRADGVPEGSQVQPRPLG